MCLEVEVPVVIGTEMGIETEAEIEITALARMGERQKTIEINVPGAIVTAGLGPESNQDHRVGVETEVGVGKGIVIDQSEGEQQRNGKVIDEIEIIEMRI